MPRTATRTASIFTRVDPETKDQAELIFKQLGIPMSSAIGMFLRQIVLQNGIPFEMKLPDRKPVSMESLTVEQLNLELQKGYDDIEAGNIHSADEVEAEIRSIN